MNIAWWAERTTVRKMPDSWPDLYGLNCHINLIPVNPIKERNFVQSDKKVIENFKNKLEKYRINVTIRREMGRDIDGACGQLRKKYSDRQENTTKDSAEEK